MLLGCAKQVQFSNNIRQLVPDTDQLNLWCSGVTHNQGVCMIRCMNVVRQKEYVGTRKEQVIATLNCMKHRIVLLRKIIAANEIKDCV